MPVKVNIEQSISGGRTQGYVEAFEGRADEIITVSIFDLAKTADLANEVCRIVLRYRSERNPGMIARKEFRARVAGDRARSS